MQHMNARTQCRSAAAGEFIFIHVWAISMTSFFVHRHRAEHGAARVLM